MLLGSNDFKCVYYHQHEARVKNNDFGGFSSTEEEEKWWVLKNRIIKFQSNDPNLHSLYSAVLSPLGWWEGDSFIISKINELRELHGAIYR